MLFTDIVYLREWESNLGEARIDDRIEERDHDQDENGIQGLNKSKMNIGLILLFWKASHVWHLRANKIKS